MSPVRRTVERYDRRAARPRQGRDQPEASPGLSRRAPGGRYGPPGAGMGDPLLPDLLHSRRRRARQTRAERRDHPLPQPWRGHDLRRDRRRRHRAGRCAALPRFPATGTERAGPAGLGRHGRVVRGGRAGVRPPARPVFARRHPRQLPAHPGRDRRRRRRGLPQPAHPLRNRPSRTLLPPSHRRALGPPAALRHPLPLPLQGTADYWTVRIGDKEYPDIAWIYRTPLPESQKIAGLACFYNEKVDVWIDGVLEERPRSPFS